MSKRLPSSLILIIFGVIQIFFNQVIIAPYIYKLNYKLGFFILLIIYFIQSLMFIYFKNKYEHIRSIGLEYYQYNKKSLYFIYFILFILISCILILYLIYFFFNFINSYFFVNATYIFIIPLLFIVVSFGLSLKFYAIFQFGIMVFIVLAIQYFIFFFAPKDIDISIFLPLDYSLTENNIKIFFLIPSIIFITLLSLPSSSLASTPFRKKEVVIISILFFLINGYFLFMQTKQLGILLAYLDHPFYSIFDALELGFYSEHLYIVPVTLCIIGTFLFILILLHNINHISQKNITKNLNFFFLFLLIITMLLFKDIQLLESLINFLMYVLSGLFLILFIITKLYYKERRKS